MLGVCRVAKAPEYVRGSRTIDESTKLLPRSTPRSVLGSGRCRGPSRTASLGASRIVLLGVEHGEIRARTCWGRGAGSRRERKSRRVQPYILFGGTSSAVAGRDGTRRSRADTRVSGDCFNERYRLGTHNLTVCPNLIPHRLRRLRLRPSTSWDTRPTAVPSGPSSGSTAAASS